MAAAKKGGMDLGLLVYFAFWYLGNYYYNIQNKKALKAGGGKDGFPMTISTLQLGVGVIYALFLWVAPDARKPPKITFNYIIKMMPVAICSAAAHSASVFALSAGAVSFGQIVKAGEPVFAAVVGTLFYGSSTSLAKWLCLIPVVGGVCLASVKELDFAVSALVSASLANLFAAFKSSENKKLMKTPGLKDDLGSAGNQFAVTKILALLVSLPVMFAKEGHKWGEFVELFNTNAELRNNLILSGLTFYGYNELATMTLKKISGVTHSVANTAKRVVIIVGSAIAFGDAMPPMKILGCSIAIGGVFLYSTIENFLPKKSKTN